MAKGGQTEREERRRFEEKERKVWSEEDRKEYLKRREQIAPFVRDLTTPPPKKKGEEEGGDFFARLFGK